MWRLLHPIPGPYPDGSSSIYAFMIHDHYHTIHALTIHDFTIHDFTIYVQDEACERNGWLKFLKLSKG